MILVTISRSHVTRQEYAQTEIFSDEEYLRALYYIGSQQVAEDFVSATLVLRSDEKDSDVIMVDEYFAMVAGRLERTDLKRKLGSGRMSRQPVRGQAP